MGGWGDRGIVINLRYRNLVMFRVKERCGGLLTAGALVLQGEAGVLALGLPQVAGSMVGDAVASTHLRRRRQCQRTLIPAGTVCRER